MIVIKPGILVSMKTSVGGGIVYERTDLSDEKVGTSETTRWETVKIVNDVEDFNRAGVVRGEASAMIRKVCIKSAFGLICLSTNEAELQKAIAEAMQMCNNYNRSGVNKSFVRINVLQGRIADNDAEASRGIAQEMMDIIDQMKQGIVNFDVRSIRDAAGKAREVSKILEGQEAEVVANAVAAARKAARMIAKRVEKGGEEALVVFRDLQLGPIDIARFAFMDPEVQSNQPADADTAPAINVQRFAEIDASEGIEQHNEEAVDLASLFRRYIDVSDQTYTEVP